MSHINVVCIANDCESLMSALVGEIFDYYSEIEEGPLSGITTVDEIRAVVNDGKEFVNVVIEYGYVHDTESKEEALSILGKYDGDTPCMVYDAHI